MPPAGLGLGRAALKVAEDPQWGPSGIRAISCWFNEKRYEPQAIYTVPRSQGSPAAHRAAIDPNANAWAEIRQGHRGRWKVRVVPKIEAARIAPPDPASDSDLVMLLRSGDLVAWETPGGREVGYLKVMKSNGGLFFWPLRLAANMKAAPLSLNVPIKQRDGIYFSGGLRKVAPARSPSPFWGVCAIRPRLGGGLPMSVVEVRSTGASVALNGHRLAVRVPSGLQPISMPTISIS